MSTVLLTIELDIDEETLNQYNHINTSTILNNISISLSKDENSFIITRSINGFRKDEFFLKNAKIVKKELI